MKVTAVRNLSYVCFDSYFDIAHIHSSECNQIFEAFKFQPSRYQAYHGFAVDPARMGSIFPDFLALPHCLNPPVIVGAI